MNAALPLQTLRRLDTRASGFDEALAGLIAFEAAQDPAIDSAVASIIADVRARGDAALLEYTRRFDRVSASSMAESASSVGSFAFCGWFAIALVASSVCDPDIAIQPFRTGGLDAQNGLLAVVPHRRGAGLLPPVIHPIGLAMQRKPSR